MSINEKWIKYYGMNTGFNHIPFIEYPNAATIRYNEQKQIVVFEINYLPGVERGILYEIHNVIDVTDAYRKTLTMMTMILIETCKLVQTFTIEHLIEEERKAVEWAKNYQLASAEQKLPISSDAEQNGITHGMSV
jgi:hypothetical protein